MRSDPHKVAAAAISGVCERLAVGGISEDQAEAQIREELDRWHIPADRRAVVLATAAAYPPPVGAAQARALLERIAATDDFDRLEAAELERQQKRRRLAIGPEARLG